MKLDAKDSFNEVREKINKTINELENVSPSLAKYLKETIKLNEEDKAFCYEPKLIKECEED